MHSFGSEGTEHPISCAYGSGLRAVLGCLNPLTVQCDTSKGRAAPPFLRQALGPTLEVCAHATTSLQTRLSPAVIE